MKFPPLNGLDDAPMTATLLGEKKNSIKKISQNKAVVYVQINV
jgi:hypothetical protein